MSAGGWIEVKVGGSPVASSASLCDQILIILLSALTQRPAWNLMLTIGNPYRWSLMAIGREERTS
eukprot:scaffold170014_cov26-Tisochrysis_lutea.AAC.3